MKKTLSNHRGMTLIELLAVLVILAIIAAIAIPSISKIIENSRINVEKTNAIILINAASLYFVENPENNHFTNSVGIPTLISEGYITDMNLVNDSFWIAEEKPPWICGFADTKKNRVEFRKATVQMIQDSGKSTKVGTSSCGNMEALPTE